MARDLAIDLGTANTLVYARGEGIVLNEPSVIALNSRSGEVLAMGHEAWQMIGRTPSYIVAVRPLRKGAITDFEVTQRMIRLLLQRVGVSRLNRPINEPIGNMVVDIGGGTTESALISLGGVVALEAVRVGSFDIDNAIQGYVRREYGIAVGERTAEEIKIVLGLAYPTDGEVSAEVRGRELMSGLPKTVVLTPDEIRSAIEEPVTAMVDSVVSCLAQAPPELAQDLIVQGVHLVGGGGMLKGMDLRLTAESDVPVRRVNSPLESVVLGAGKVIEHYESVQAMFMDDAGGGRRRR
ncbi:MAG: rod shape-determining protein [Actinobacteria bacterium]|nr:rod shape-determining protein [Actinomycetota bacterium]